MLSLDSHSSVDTSLVEVQTPSRARLPIGRQQIRIDSASLLQGTRELLIAHAGEDYRLRLTRNDKLILTK